MDQNPNIKCGWINIFIVLNSQKIICKDIRELSLNRKYDVIAYLGVGAQEVYGNIRDALKIFQANLSEGGFLFFAEQPCKVTHPKAYWGLTEMLLLSTCSVT